MPDHALHQRGLGERLVALRDEGLVLFFAGRSGLLVHQVAEATLDLPAVVTRHEDHREPEAEHAGRDQQREDDLRRAVGRGREEHRDRAHR